VLVTLQFVASDFVLRHLIYRQAIGSLPGIGLPAIARSRNFNRPAFVPKRQELRRAAFALRCAASEGW